MRTIARRWWPSVGGDRDWERVNDITWHRHDQFPRLLRMLVRTAPQGGISYVGTAVIEDLVYQAEDRNEFGWVVPLILSARLDQAQTFELLTGVVPRLLNLIDARTSFAGILSATQIAWLLDDDSDRWTTEGTPTAHGDDVRVIPGDSEWERLYYGR